MATDSCHCFYIYSVFVQVLPQAFFIELPSVLAPVPVNASSHFRLASVLASSLTSVHQFSPCPAWHVHHDSPSGPTSVQSSLAVVGPPPFIGSTRKAITTATPILKHQPRRHSTVFGGMWMYIVFDTGRGVFYLGWGVEASSCARGLDSARENVLTSSDRITLGTSWGSHRSHTPPSVL